jgi:hypothetical protein
MVMVGLLLLLLLLLHCVRHMQTNSQQQDAQGKGLSSKTSYLGKLKQQNSCLKSGLSMQQAAHNTCFWALHLLLLQVQHAVGRGSTDLHSAAHAGECIKQQ